MPEQFLGYSKYFMVLLGWLAGAPLVWTRRGRLGLERPWQAALTGLGFSCASVASALLFASLEGLLRGNGFRFGAISTYGVYFIAPALLALLARGAGMDAGSLFDVFALYALPSLFLLRINCLISGCCGGRAIGNTGLHWPTRQAEMVFYAVMLLALLRREKAGAAKGTAFPLLTASYGVFRFVEEWFRAGDGPGLIHLAHGWSLAAAVLGFGLYFELCRGRTKQNGPRRERGVLKC